MSLIESARARARAAVVDEHIRCENSHDLDALMATFGINAQYDDEPWGDHRIGRDGVRSYYSELMRTPTGRDPVIKKFMDRWSVEELHHGNLLNRFLEEAGYPTGKNWQAEAMRSIPRSYLVGSYVADYASRAFGTSFHHGRTTSDSGNHAPERCTRQSGFSQTTG